MASERVIRRIVRNSWKVGMGLVSRTFAMLVTKNVKASICILNVISGLGPLSVSYLIIRCMKLYVHMCSYVMCWT